jgi:hypothetical protein
MTYQVTYISLFPLYPHVLRPVSRQVTFVEYTDTCRLKINCNKGLISNLVSEIDGYILYSMANESNTALTMASASQGNVIVASNMCSAASLLDSLGVPLVGDVAGMMDTNAVLLGKTSLSSIRDSGLISNRMIAFAPNDGSKASCLSGYVVFARMAIVEFSYESDDVVNQWSDSLAHLNPNTLNAAVGWFTGGDEYG